MSAGRRARGGLGPGVGLAALAGLALLAFTFLRWYGWEVSGQVARIEVAGVGAGGSAWDSVPVLAALLWLAGLAALAAAALRLWAPAWRPAIAPAAVVTVLGGLCSLLVLLRILFPPDLGRLGGVAIEATLGPGAWLGLAAALAVAVGGYRAMAEEGTSFAAVAARLAPR